MEDLDYLSAVSKEKFRRRLLIGSRILSFFLILGLVYWGYTYSIYGDKVSKNPCWACGYYVGMKCEPVLFTPQEIAAAGKENLLKQLGDYNSEPNKTRMKDRLAEKTFSQEFNLSILNISE